MTASRITAIAAALALWASTPALAQSLQLPCTTAAKQTLTQNDRDQINQYAAEGIALLNAQEPAEIQRGRDRLLAPLRCPDVSAAFRVEYGNALNEGLNRVITSGDAFRATNGLLVAGMIASNKSVQSIAGAMRSSSETVRAAAAVALQHTLREQVSGRARLTSTVAEGAIANAGRQLASEDSPTVVESMIVALRAGADADSPLVSQALKALGEGAAGAFAKARASADPDTMAWALAAERTTETIWRATYDAQVREIDQAQSVAAANACAQIIAYARDRAADEDQPMTDEERELLVKSIDSAEAALILIHSRVVGGAPVSKSLSDAFKRSADRFASETNAWIGASGRLIKAPYRLKADELAAQ